VGSSNGFGETFLNFKTVVMRIRRVFRALRSAASAELAGIWGKRGVDDDVDE